MQRSNNRNSFNMSIGQIFISYRRDDSAGYVRALYDRLVQHFAKERVFMDVDAIDPGLPFDEAIKRALDQCEVLLVVIGRRWMDKQAGAAHQRSEGFCTHRDCGGVVNPGHAA